MLSISVLAKLIITGLLNFILVEVTAVNYSFRKNNKALLYTYILCDVMCSLVMLFLLLDILGVFHANTRLITGFVCIISVLTLLASINNFSTKEIYYNRNKTTLSIVFASLSIVFCIYLLIVSKVGNFSGEAYIGILLSIFLYAVCCNLYIYKTKKYAKIIGININEYTKRHSSEYEKVLDKFFKKKIIRNKVYNSYYDGNIVILMYYIIKGFILSIVSLGLLFPYAYCKYQKYNIKHIKINDNNFIFFGESKKLFKKYIKWWALTILSGFLLSGYLVFKVKQYKVANIIVNNKKDNKEYVAKRKIYKRIAIGSKSLTISYYNLPEFEKSDIVYTIKLSISLIITLIIVLL